MTIIILKNLSVIFLGSFIVISEKLPNWRALEIETKLAD